MNNIETNEIEQDRHSPLPWRCLPLAILSADAQELAVMRCNGWLQPPETEQAANAELIVKAVNNHQALVDALCEIRAKSSSDLASPQVILDTIFEVANNTLEQVKP